MSTGTWSASLQSESPACSVCLERSPLSVYQAPGQSRCVQQSNKAQKHKIQRKLPVKLKLLLRIISWHFYALLPTQCLRIAFLPPLAFSVVSFPGTTSPPLTSNGTNCSPTASRPCLGLNRRPHCWPGQPDTSRGGRGGKRDASASKPCQCQGQGGNPSACLSQPHSPQNALKSFVIGPQLLYQYIALQFWWYNNEFTRFLGYKKKHCPKKISFKLNGIQSS